MRIRKQMAMNKPVLSQKAKEAKIAKVKQPVNTLDLFEDKEFLKLSLSDQFDTLMSEIYHNKDDKHCWEIIRNEIKDLEKRRKNPLLRLTMKQRIEIAKKQLEKSRLGRMHADYMEQAMKQDKEDVAKMWRLRDERNAKSNRS